MPRWRPWTGAPKPICLSGQSAKYSRHYAISEGRTAWEVVASVPCSSTSSTTILLWTLMVKHLAVFGRARKARTQRASPPYRSKAEAAPTVAHPIAVAGPRVRSLCPLLVTIKNNPTSRAWPLNYTTRIAMSMLNQMIWWTVPTTNLSQTLIGTISLRYDSTTHALLLWMVRKLRRRRSKMAGIRVPVWKKSKCAVTWAPSSTSD